MEVRVVFESGGPPAGTVELVGDSRIASQFVGWVGLLRALADAVAADDLGGDGTGESPVGPL